MNGNDTETDENLAAQAATGDRAAFETLVRRHKSSLFRFVRRYVGNPDDAYDVLQDTFISVWSGLRRYDSTRPFLPWLRTIALNKCRDFGRRLFVRRLMLRTRAAQPEDPPAPPADSDSISAEALESQRLAEVDAAIAALPPFYKEPLLLTIVSGLSHREAADLLKTTAKAVEMRVYRARRKILEAVGDPTGGGIGQADAYSSRERTRLS